MLETQKIKPKLDQNDTSLLSPWYFAILLPIITLFLYAVLFCVIYIFISVILWILGIEETKEQK